MGAIHRDATIGRANMGVGGWRSCISEAPELGVQEVACRRRNCADQPALLPCQIPWGTRDARTQGHRDTVSEEGMRRDEKGSESASAKNSFSWPARGWMEINHSKFRCMTSGNDGAIQNVQNGNFHRGPPQPNPYQDIPPRGLSITPVPGGEDARQAQSGARLSMMRIASPVTRGRSSWIKCSGHARMMDDICQQRSTSLIGCSGLYTASPGTRRLRSTTVLTVL